MPLRAENRSIPRFRSWWAEGENASQRLETEIAAIHKLFNINTPQILSLPPTQWDVDKVTITTRSTRLRPLSHGDFCLWWQIYFSMDDEKYLGTKKTIKTVWRMVILYPHDFPEGIVKISIPNYPRRIGDRPQDQHVLGSETVDGESFPIACHYQHSPQDPLCRSDATAAEHAKRGICWLRAKLFAYYFNNDVMPDYL